MKRLDWLMQDREKLKDFIEMVEKQDYDCQNCPFMREDGWVYGCNAGGVDIDGEPNDEMDCQLNYEDASDFLEEEMPTEEQIEIWKKELKSDK